MQRRSHLFELVDVVIVGLVILRRPLVYRICIIAEGFQGDPPLHDAAQAAMMRSIGRSAMERLKSSAPETTQQPVLQEQVPQRSCSSVLLLQLTSGVFVHEHGIHTVVTQTLITCARVAAAGPVHRVRVLHERVDQLGVRRGR